MNMSSGAVSCEPLPLMRDPVNLGTSEVELPSEPPPTAARSTFLNFFYPERAAECAAAVADRYSGSLSLSAAREPGRTWPARPV